MDPISTVALAVVLSAVFFYVLYIVVRAAVLSALRARDAERGAVSDAEGRSTRR